MVGDAPARRSPAPSAARPRRRAPTSAEFARGYASLVDSEAPASIPHTMRSVIDPDGQRVSALDRLYLADQIPTLMIWGAGTR